MSDNKWTSDPTKTEVSLVNNLKDVVDLSVLNGLEGGSMHFLSICGCRTL